MKRGSQAADQGVGDRNGGGGNPETPISSDLPSSSHSGFIHDKG